MIKSYTHLEWYKYLKTIMIIILYIIIVPLTVGSKALVLGWTCVGVSALNKQRNSCLLEMQGVIIKQNLFKVK